MECPYSLSGYARVLQAWLAEGDFGIEDNTIFWFPYQSLLILSKNHLMHWSNKEFHEIKGGLPPSHLDRNIVLSDVDVES